MKKILLAIAITLALALPEGRKPDPGPHFPWDRVIQELQEAGVKYE